MNHYTHGSTKSSARFGLRTLALMGLGLGLVFGPGVHAQDEEAPAKPEKVQWRRLQPDQLVGENSLVYLHTRNYKDSIASFKRSAFYGMMIEPDIQDPLMSAWLRIQDAYVKGDGARTSFEMRRKALELSVFQKIATYFNEHVALAITLPELREGANLNQASHTKPGFLLVLTLPMGEEGQLKQQTLADILDRSAAGQLIDQRFQDHLKKVGSYNIQELECQDLELHESWAFVENLFIYGQGDGVVENAVRNYVENRGAGSLNQNRGYAAAQSEVGEGTDLYIQFDFTPLLKPLAQSAPALQQVLGVQVEEFEKSRPHLALGMKVQPGEMAAIKEKLLVRLPEGMRNAGGEACQAFTAYLTSGNTLIYTADQSSLVAWIKFFNRFAAVGDDVEEGPNPLKNLMPELMRAVDVATEEAAFEKLAPFKGEMAFMLNLVPTERNFNDSLQAVFALEFNREDMANVTDVLDKIKKATKLQYNKINEGGTDLWYQFGAQPNEPQQGGQTRPFLSTVTGASKAAVNEDEAPGIPFFVSYALMEVDPQLPGQRARWFLLLSDNLKALKKAIRQAGVPRVSLAERDSFKKALAEFNDGRYWINFIDLPALVTSLYREILPRISAASGGSTGTLDRLPNSNVILPYLTPMAWSLTAVNDGQLIEFISPTGNFPLMGLIGAFAWPEINDAAADRVSRTVDENLKRIGLGLHAYAADFDRFPIALSDLYPTYVKDLAVFASPFNRNAVTRKEDIDVPLKTNLVYVPGHSLQGMSREVMIFEVRPTNLVRTKESSHILHHVLQLNNKVAPKTRANLNKLLDDQLDKVTKELQEAEKAAGM